MTGNRPNYSDALIEDRAALRPARVLDVGCGAGLPDDRTILIGTQIDV